MELTKKQLLQLEHGLANVALEPHRKYSPLVLRRLEEEEDILGPLCSRCPHAELTMDIVSSGGGVSWNYLILVSCRCSKTLKEYITSQIYLDWNGIVSDVGEKERHYSKLTHKMICENYPMKGETQQPSQQQQSAPQQQQSVPQQQPPVQSQQPAQQAKPV